MSDFIAFFVCRVALSSAPRSRSSPPITQHTPRCISSATGLASVSSHTPRWGDAVTCWERGVCDLSQRTYGNPRRGPKPAARRARVSECLEPGPMANPRPLSQHYPQLQSTIKGARIGWIGWSLSFSWLSLLANIWIISHGNAELHSALTAREARSSGS